MKRNKLAKKLTATLLAGAMVMSTGMTAFATEGNDEGTASITKVLNKPENVLTPRTSFQFEIAYSGEQTGVEDINTSEVGSAVTFTDNNDTITPTDEELANTSDILTYSEKLPLSVDITKYEKPGVYRYNITEVTPEDAYEGIDYSDNTLFFDVAIGYAEGDQELSVLYSKFVTVNEAGKYLKGDGIFTNDYGTGDADGELGNLIVKKEVAGNQVEAGKDYYFTISITDREANEEFNVIYGADETSATTKNGMVTVPLKAGESLTVYGLSAGDKYTVAEADYSDENYTTSFIIADSTNNNIESSAVNEHDYTTGSHTLNRNGNNELVDATATFTNTKNAATPTGIAMTFAPYAVMVVFAGVFAVMFLRKKREDF